MERALVNRDESSNKVWRAAGHAALSVDALERAAAKERNAVLAERFGALAWHVRHIGYAEYAFDVAVGVAAGLMSLGRGAEAVPILRAVAHLVATKGSRNSEARASALALILRHADDEHARRLFQDRPNYRWKDTLADQLSKETLEELRNERLHGAVRKLGAAAGFAATCIAARPKGIALARVERHLDERLLPMLRARLTSKADAALARALSKMELQAPTLASRPKALDPKRETHPVVRRLKERAAKRPGLRSSRTVLDLLTIAACAWARGRDRAALEILDGFVAAPFAGDFDVWAMQGTAIAFHGALGGKPTYVLRLEARPPCALEAEWLDERAALVRTLPRDAPGLALKKPTDLTLCRFVHRFGWVAVAKGTDLLGRRLSRPEIDAAWRAGKDALAATLAR